MPFSVDESGPGLQQLPVVPMLLIQFTQHANPLSFDKGWLNLREDDSIGLVDQSAQIWELASGDMKLREDSVHDLVDESVK